VVVGITVDVRGAAVLATLRNGNKRIAFAVVNALNKTIRDVQVAEQVGVEREFTVRRKEFVKRQAAVISKRAGGGFASVKGGRFEAQVAVGQKPRLLLSGFEKGGDRRAAMAATGATLKGKRSAVPVVGGPARPSFASVVPKEFEFRALSIRKATKRGGMAKRRARAAVTFRANTTSGGAVQFKGKQRTFVLLETKQAPEGGVFQRVGPGRGDIRMVYSFKADEKLEPRLEFVKRARGVAVAKFAGHLQAEVRSSLAFAASRAFG
jgi:hypothetical protein